ncbi:MAG TPA: PilN domain-containing protein [Kiritimatiellia bacterium]
MSEDTISALAIRRGHLEWTTLERKKGKVELAGQHDAQIELPQTAPDLPALFTRGDAQVEPQLVAQLKAKCSALRGRLCVALPTEQILLRVVRLPTTDTAEIRSMAELQVDKFSPFPADLMAVAIEVLEQKDGGSLVLIAAAQKEHIDKLGALFNGAELYPREIDVAVMGWWRLLKDHGDVLAEGRHMILILDEYSTELIVTQGGVPVMFRSLGSHRNMSPVESATEIGEEVNYTLTTLEAEWGSFDAGSLQVWHWEASPTEFLAQLKEECSIPIEKRHLEALSRLSEGLARRAIDRSPAMLDLAPHQWGETIMSRKARKTMILVVGTVVAVWLLAFVGFWLALSLKKAGIASLRASVDRLKEPKAQVLKLKNQVETLQRYTSRSDSPVECLMIISTRLPTGVELASFTYKKYDNISLRGDSDTDEPIYNFFTALQEEPLFKEVKPDAVTAQQRGGRQVSQFRVTLALPKEGE